MDLLSLLLTQQVGAIFTETVEELGKLPTEHLDQLALDVRGFKTIDDLTNWLKQRHIHPSRLRSDFKTRKKLLQ